MTPKEIASKLDATVEVEAERDCNGVYVGDFLSRVMGKAPPSCVWLTVMNNINVAGVAALAEVGAVVLCEGVAPDKLLKSKCADERIPLLTTSLTAYEACLRLAK